MKNRTMELLSFLVSALWTVLVLFVIWYFFLTDCDSILAFTEVFGKPIASLSKKVVWVTGASTGLGEAMAYELASVGAKLVLTARSKDLLDKVKQTCIDRSGGRLTKDDILVLSFDISNLECHKENVNAAIQHFGKVDVLVNNAARYQVSQCIETETNVDRFLFDVNYFGPISLTKQLLKHFLKQGGGRIVVVSSLAGKMGIPSTASYSGTKHALQGYFDALHMEHRKDNVSVTFVVPGIFSSSILKKTVTTSADKILWKDYEHYECTNMTSERCAHLALVATANRLYESWIAYQPQLFMLWGSQYIPDGFKLVMSILYNKKRLSQLFQGEWPRDLPVWAPITRKKFMIH